MTDQCWLTTELSGRLPLLAEAPLVRGPLERQVRRPLVASHYSPDLLNTCVVCSHSPLLVLPHLFNRAARVRLTDCRDVRFADSLCHRRLRTRS